MDDYTIRQSLFLCSLLGCNPNVPFGKIQLLLTTGTVSSAVVVGLLLFLQIIFPGEDTMNMEVVSNILTVISSLLFVHKSVGLFQMISKIVLMINKRKEIQEIFKHMSTIFWRIEDVADEKERTAYKKILLMGRCTLHVWSALFVVRLCCVCRAKSLPLNCYQPKWIPLSSIIALQDLTFILLFWTIIGIDGIIISFFLMTAIQLKMLNREIEAMFDTNDKGIIARKVTTLIEHHDFMLRFTRLINDTISSSMVIFIGNIVTNICVYLYHFTVMNSISFAIIRDLDVVAMTLIEFFGAFCIPAQLCIDQAEEIKHSVYFSKWYEHPQYHRHISMMIARDSLGITMNAGGIIRLDLETALSVVRVRTHLAGNR
nr:unnamed protein product [Callosobruchus chinensis]